MVSQFVDLNFRMPEVEDSKLVDEGLVLNADLICRLSDGFRSQEKSASVCPSQMTTVGGCDAVGEFYTFPLKSFSIKKEPIIENLKFIEATKNQQVTISQKNASVEGSGSRDVASLLQGSVFAPIKRPKTIRLFRLNVPSPHIDQSLQIECRKTLYTRLIFEVELLKVVILQIEPNNRS